jgi:hypothetical protein
MAAYATYLRYNWQTLLHEALGQLVVVAVAIGIAVAVATLLGVSTARRSWIARAHNFRSRYGTQRGGIELSVGGRPDARVGVVAGPVRAEVPLQALERSPRVSLLDDDSAYLALQRGTGGLLGMGLQQLAMPCVILTDREPS